MKVAIVGATGNVGRVILQILEESSLLVSEIVPLGSSGSKGKKLSFRERDIFVQSLSEYDFFGTDIALFSAGSGISEIYAPIAADAGCIVIDNTSHFRMHNDIPLIIPEINGELIGEYQKTNIIANPNCSTIQMLMVLAPLHRRAKIKRIVVSTYQSVSGAGKNAMDELFKQTKSIYVNQQFPPKLFPKQIAFNCIPQIDSFMEDGYTKEEWKMLVETKKILDKDIKVSATCVRVPVFVGHAESVNVEFYEDIELDEVYEILEESPGVLIHDRRANGGYATQVDVACEYSVYVSRIRMDETVRSGLNMWIVADNLRKGAALNAVQIAEILARDYL